MVLNTKTSRKWISPLPDGWTDASRKKYWDTLTREAPVHKVTECIKKIKDTDITNPGAFCGALADDVIPGWRKEVAEKKEKKKKKALMESRDHMTQPLRTRRDYGEESRLGEGEIKESESGDSVSFENLIFKVATKYLRKKSLC